MATNEELTPLLIPVPVRVGERGDVRLRQYLATFEIQGVGSVEISLINGGAGLVFDHGPHVIEVAFMDMGAEVLKMMGVEGEDQDGPRPKGDISLCSSADDDYERREFSDLDAFEEAYREGWLDEYLAELPKGSLLVDGEGDIWDWRVGPEREHFEYQRAS